MLVKLIKGSSGNIFIQLFRYFWVGGIAFLVDFLLLYLLTEYLSLHYLISATISFTVGLFTNYLLSIRWVFNNSTLSNRFLEFIVFAGIGCIGLILNAGFICFFTEICAFYYLHSKLLATGLVFFWNFSARKVILFKTNKSTGSTDKKEAPL